MKIFGSLFRIVVVGSAIVIAVATRNSLHSTETQNNTAEFIVLFEKKNPLCEAVRYFLNGGNEPPIKNAKPDESIQSISWSALPGYVDKDGAPIWAQPAFVQNIDIDNDGTLNVLVRDTSRQGRSIVTNRIQIWETEKFPFGHETEIFRDPHRPRLMRNAIKMELTLSQISERPIYFFKKLEPGLATSDDWFGLFRSPPLIRSTGLWHVFTYQDRAYFLVSENSLNFDPQDPRSLSIKPSNAYLVGKLEGGKWDDLCYLARRDKNEPAYGEWIDRYSPEMNK